MAIDASHQGRDGKNNRTGKFAVLHIYRSSTGETGEMTVFSTPQDITLNPGDKIKCVEGMAFVLVKPGTSAGGYIVCPQIPLLPGVGEIGKYVVVLEINEETIRVRPRGAVSADIGNISRGTGGTSR